MGIKKTLASIALLGVMAFGTTGCNDYSQYKYNGKIGEEQVTFIHKNYLIGNYNTLTVKKSDGRVINYKDLWSNDLNLEDVSITANGKTIDYARRNKVEKVVLEVAQKKFDKYLQKIKEAKIRQGLENLK